MHNKNLEEEIIPLRKVVEVDKIDDSVQTDSIIDLVSSNLSRIDMDDLEKMSMECSHKIFTFITKNTKNLDSQGTKHDFINKLITEKFNKLKYTESEVYRKDLCKNLLKERLSAINNKDLHDNSSDPKHDVNENVNDTKSNSTKL
eukprot:CAMPEP_0116923804 /NCGR_PEP_ID=MMETSP0467-20121206/23111_1 /TAXON_ID=283647 /ORGANISM="Mesodinium pulex, Strain SPMC105" /LENGTH=144 /DNA_ID=CAMNT_0004602467 /DNA_START=506 /DNA_END=940 /DNA_ORIENTATION=+